MMGPPLPPKRGPAPKNKKVSTP